MLYADIIVDISHENLDKTYQYAVPNELLTSVSVGSQVIIPFGKGNRFIKGYILGLSLKPKINVSFIKPIKEMVLGSIPIETELIALAYQIKERFGSTMNDALKTVIPIKKEVKTKEKRYIKSEIDSKILNEHYNLFLKKHNMARARLLGAILDNGTITYEFALETLKINRTTMNALEDMGLICIKSETVYRNPVKSRDVVVKKIQLNKEQEIIVDDFVNEYSSGIRKNYLIHGVTGSGKTEVYIEMISHVIKSGKQVIMLIPEIALTYQTVMRFYNRFGDRISILNSRMSGGERYDQFLRAKNGEIDIMIGPRSALFTPFNRLGLILIDEEHETSYKSENPPKYHAREVAIMRGEMTGTSVVLGSATPSLEAYKMAREGKLKLYQLRNRAGKGCTPKIWTVDLREELKAKNKSIFSRKLKELVLQRLQRKEQIMLFINRRGYAGFVSCRSCGHVVKCPHCDVSLKYHRNDKLICHYCGYEEDMPKKCPICGSKFIATFGTGTQKVEELVHKEFPGARVLRMDTDTTSGKDGHEKILAAFANHEADILVGTQMIVKGHDFKDVTLVGIIAADLSLYANDYRAAEKTFQLLLQASGRAGRASDNGEVVIQTYNPEHYSVIAAANQDYETFYNQEISYRSLMHYPPSYHILVILVMGKEEDRTKICSNKIGTFIKQNGNIEIREMIGPCDASISKINDIFRQVIYVKDPIYENLIEIKSYLEDKVKETDEFKGLSIQYDFNPMNSY